MEGSEDRKAERPPIGRVGVLRWLLAVPVIVKRDEVVQVLYQGVQPVQLVLQKRSILFPEEAWPRPG